MVKRSKSRSKLIIILTSVIGTNVSFHFNTTSQIFKNLLPKEKYLHYHRKTYQYFPSSYLFIFFYLFVFLCILRW